MHIHRSAFTMAQLWTIYFFNRLCVATVLYRASFTIRFLFIGCLPKKNNRLLVTPFSLYPCIWITASLSNVKSDDAFISWLDGHECTIVYCMSLRVLIERSNAAKTQKKLYSTHRIKQFIFLYRSNNWSKMPKYYGMWFTCQVARNYVIHSSHDWDEEPCWF